MKQQTKGRVREDREFDKTQLKSTAYSQRIHRDWIAHVLRWGWVARQIEQGSSILDIGCGQEQNLAKVLAGRPGGNREKYVGVDLNKISKPFNCKWATIIDKFNFIRQWEELAPHGPFDSIVLFEVIEHMSVENGRKLLKRVKSLLKRDGKFYLSTPVFNGSAAANHVHEYEIKELATLLIDAGFKVERRVGTFASKSDIYKHLNQHEVIVYNRLNDWFGNDIMSMIFASLYPDQSRNNVWVLRRQ